MTKNDASPGTDSHRVRALLHAQYGDDASGLLDVLRGMVFQERGLTLRNRLSALRLLLSYESSDPPATVEVPDEHGRLHVVHITMISDANPLRIGAQHADA